LIFCATLFDKCSTMMESVEKGKCDPCCSIEPKGIIAVSILKSLIRLENDC